MDLDAIARLALTNGANRRQPHRTVHADDLDRCAWTAATRQQQWSDWLALCLPDGASVHDLLEKAARLGHVGFPLNGPMPGWEFDADVIRSHLGFTADELGVFWDRGIVYLILPLAYAQRYGLAWIDDDTGIGYVNCSPVW
jgi:hypothetical protein